MTVKLYEVEFKERIAQFTIHAKTLDSAVRAAIKLWKAEISENPSKSDDGKTTYDWDYYVRNGFTQPIKAELIAESDN